ncbi:hypothetical protein [Nannocystis radixulma]|uniref:Neurotransmitter-gated ion-channel ligand binding domain-containing protein n=1 Tax=Nannocystis radixulma TaxID=2995305 RepID=A0ABT5B9U2_9BACT|nr:hypothetical protein [Nannocystis radixulma]MDC0670907.1 hypothetical protein [Nannocystis radixulma]
MKPWRLSFAATVPFAAGVLFVWRLELAGIDPSHATPVIDEDAVDRFVAESGRRSGRANMPAPVRIETGLELHAIVFPGPHDVIVTGYIWQLYPPSSPRRLSRGVVFPDAVPVDDDVMRRAWRVDTPRGEVVGWYFRTTLHRRVDYAKFPIDERRVVLHMWHADPTEDVVLVPHFAAYHAMFPALRPGLRDRLQVPGWTVESSEFSLATTERRTGFGLPGFAAEGEVPELGFEVRLTRNFTDAFVSNLLPLMIVAMLLFGVLMTASLDKERAEHHGFTSSAAYATSAALLFVALVGHLQIRQEVATPQILYIEYFYFVAYFMILAVSVVVFITATPGPHPRFITYGDVLLPKVLYWPLSFALFFAVTVRVFY